MHWTIAHMILDLVQNSIEASAKEIQLDFLEQEDTLQIAIIDDGCGMDENRRAAALNPFYTEPGKHPGRRVGLGLPFLLQTVEQTGGTYGLESEPDSGTSVRFSLDTAHVDSPPLGDVPELFVDLMCYGGEYELRIRRQKGDTSYTISRGELQEILGDISTIGNRALALDFLRDWESALGEAVHTDHVYGDH